MAYREEDLISNPTPRCACMLLLDTSGSMEGEPLAELMDGVNQFISEIKEDDFAVSSVELSIITFGGTVTKVLNFQSVEKIIEDIELSADGNTPMGAAINEAIKLLESRKNEYKKNGVSYYQPWLVLMSDGAPTDDEIFNLAAENLKQQAENKKITVFAIGIGDEADLDELSRCCPAKRPPKRLKGLKFKEFFQWLSQSLSRVSQSTPGTAQVSLPPADGWAAIES
ncbi:MAG TPA: VWA domain-containing protein [Chitinophagales bacterium]|nr:VWA domain-containing protein [Chitinophagales bacterium]HNI02829.1 VWA domain-containing protein [Chitinophagales bacterium]